MQVTLDHDQHRRAAEKAASLGLSLAEYLRRLVAADLSETEPETDFDISDLFGIGESGGSNVAQHKHRYLGEAIAAAKSAR